MANAAGRKGISEKTGMAHSADTPVSAYQMYRLQGLFANGIWQIKGSRRENSRDPAESA